MHSEAKTGPAEASLLELLRRIQNGAADSSTRLSDVLRQASILASRLDHQPFKDWITYELDGYPSIEALPSYRKLECELRGTFVGMFGHRIDNAPIPPMTLPKDLKDVWGMIYMFNGVGYLESVANSGAADSLHAPIPGDFTAAFGKKIYQNMHAVEMWKPVPVHNIADMVVVIRSRLLQFALEIGREIPSDAALESTNVPIPSETVTQIYNTTILSPLGNVAIGGHGTTQNAAIVEVGDFASLSRFLESHGVPSEDLAALKEAITDEPELAQSGRYGPKVTAWIAAMVGKAASGVWGVGVGAAGNLLAEALQSYYG